MKSPLEGSPNKEGAIHDLFLNILRLYKQKRHNFKNKFLIKHISLVVGIQCRDSNWWSLDYGYPPLTSRPGACSIELFSM